MVAGGHVFVSPTAGLVPVRSSKTAIAPIPKPLPSIHPPAPKPVGGVKTLCAGCGGAPTLGSQPAPVYPRDQIATNPAGPIGLSSGITNPLPPTKAGITNFGTGIETFGGPGVSGAAVASLPANVSVAAPTVPTSAAPEPTNNNTALVLAGSAIALLVLGAIFL